MQVKVLPSGSCIVLHPAADQEPLVPDCLFHHLHSTALTQPRRRASEAFAGAPIHGGGACSSRPFLRMVVAGTNGGLRTQSGGQHLACLLNSNLIRPFGVLHAPPNQALDLWADGTSVVLV